MAQGFGTPKDLSRYKRQLIKTLERQDMIAFERLKDRLVLELGAEVYTHLVTSEVLVEASLEAADWFWRSILSPEKYAQMKDMAMTTMIQMLAEEGCELGKDISMVENEGVKGFAVSAKAEAAIFAQIPPEHHAQVRSMLKTETLPSGKRNAAAALEDHLGVPFFDNLLQQALERVPTLTDGQALHYLVTICSGFEARHPEVDNFGHWFLGNVFSGLPGTQGDRLLKLMQNHHPDQPLESCTAWLGDVITAAGGGQYIHPHPLEVGEFLVTRDGIALLDQVHLGQTKASEMVAAIDAWDRKR